MRCDEVDGMAWPTAIRLVEVSAATHAGGKPGHAGGALTV